MNDLRNLESAVSNSKEPNVAEHYLTWLEHLGRGYRPPRKTLREALDLVVDNLDCDKLSENEISIKHALIRDVLSSQDLTYDLFEEIYDPIFKQIYERKKRQCEET